MWAPSKPPPKPFVPAIPVALAPQVDVAGGGDPDRALAAGVAAARPGLRADGHAGHRTRVEAAYDLRRAAVLRPRGHAEEGGRRPARRRRAVPAGRQPRIVGPRRPGDAAR